MVVNNCNGESYMGLYGNCRCQLSLYLNIELIFILDFDSESMGLAERFTSKVKDGKVCLSLVLLPLQDLQYVFCFIQSIFSNLTNEFSIIGFVWLIQVHTVSKYQEIFLNLPLSFFSPRFLFFERSSQCLRSLCLCWWRAAVRVTHKYSLTSRFIFKAPRICHC